MVNTIKFSDMPSGGNINNDDKVPGLLGGANVLFNNPWVFLPSGTTAERPAPSQATNYRLRFNTDDKLYEYYDDSLHVWTQLQESAFTVGPFVTYTASASLPDAQNLGALANGILRQTITAGVATLDIAVNGINYYGPGFVIPGVDGGTGKNNSGLTIDLSNGVNNYVLTSDASGNATWQDVAQTGVVKTITTDSGNALPSSGVIVLTGSTTGLAFSGSGNTVTLGGVLGPSSGGLGVSTPPTSGQIPIGTGSNVYTPATISSGTNILVSSSSGSITIGLTGIISGINGGTNVNNGSSSITVGGNVTYSGAFAFTGTLINTTSVTFPTSGTLATVGGTVPSLQGTANQVLVNGTSGSPVSGTAITLTTPQNIGTTSNVVFNGLQLGGLTASQAVVTDGSKNLVSLAYSATGGTSNIVSRDADGNVVFNNSIDGSTRTSSNGGTVNMTTASTRLQVLAGTQNETYVLPDATSLSTGYTYEFNNNSAGILTVNNNAAGVVCTLPAGAYARVSLLANGSPGGTWDKHFLIPSNGSYGSTGMTITGTFACGSASQFSVNTSGVVTAGTWNASLLTGTYGGTGVNNGALTINLGSATTGYVLTSDVSGNATWQAVSASGAVTTVNGDSGSATPLSGVLTLSGSTTGLTFTGTSHTVNLGGILTGANGGTGVANTGKTITIGGNLTYSGAFGFTGTLTNTTAVTFPTSGTLLSTANASGNYVSSIAGTTNQVNVSAATGAVTLSLPQNINTTASVQFHDMIVTDFVSTPYIYDPVIFDNNGIGALNLVTFQGGYSAYTSAASGAQFNYSLGPLSSTAVSQFYAVSIATGFVKNPGSTITDAIDIYVGVGAASGPGTLTNRYGIYLEAPAGGVNNYSLWSNGILAVGTTKQFQINGSGQITACGTATFNGTVDINYASPVLTLTNTSSNGRLKITCESSINYIQSGLTSTTNSAAPLLFTTMNNGTEWARFDSSGHLLLGTSTRATSTLLTIFSSTQANARITLSGQEFYQAANTSTEGIAFLCGINRSGNKQLWLADSSALTQNTTNQVLRFGVGTSLNQPFIDAVATDGTTSKKLIINSSGGNVGIGNISSPSSTLEVRGAASALTDFGMLTVGDGSSNAITMGYDTGNNWSWIYSRTNGVQSRPININNILYVNNGSGVGNLNLGIFSSGSFGGGQQVIFITNASTLPTSNPTGGGILYVDSGALKYRGSSGTITTIANA